MRSLHAWGSLGLSETLFSYSLALWGLLGWILGSWGVLGWILRSWGLLGWDLRSWNVLGWILRSWSFLDWILRSWSALGDSTLLERSGWTRGVQADSTRKTIILLNN